MRRITWAGLTAGALLLAGGGSWVGWHYSQYSTTGAGGTFAVSPDDDAIATAFYSQRIERSLLGEERRFLVFFVQDGRGHVFDRHEIAVKEFATTTGEGVGRNTTFDWSELDGRQRVTITSPNGSAVTLYAEAAPTSG